MKLLRRDWNRIQVTKFVNSNGVEDLEAIVEVALRGIQHIDSASFDNESTIDQRTPFLRTIENEIEQVVVSFGATISESAEQSNILPNNAVPRCRKWRGNFNESVQEVWANGQKTSKVT